MRKKREIINKSHTEKYKRMAQVKKREGQEARQRTGTNPQRYSQSYVNWDHPHHGGECKSRRQAQCMPTLKPHGCNHELPKVPFSIKNSQTPGRCNAEPFCDTFNIGPSKCKCAVVQGHPPTGVPDRWETTKLSRPER